MEVTYKDHILTVDGVYSPEYCQTVINFFDNMRSAGITASTNGPQRKDGQLPVHMNTVIPEMLNSCPYLMDDFLTIFWDKVYPEYEERNNILKSHVNHSIQCMKIQRTEPSGGFHNWHSETNGDWRALRRMMVYTLYLNDVEEGGETEFLQQSVRVKPKTGRIVLWPAYFTHPHRGNPPLSGTKYIATGWLEYNGAS